MDFDQQSKLAHFTKRKNPEVWILTNNNPAQKVKFGKSCFSPYFAYAREFDHNFNYDSIGLQLVFATFLPFLLLNQANEKDAYLLLDFLGDIWGKLSVCLSKSATDRQAGFCPGWVLGIRDREKDEG